MFKVGNIIDGKYKVTGICSTEGGMGDILFVDSITAMQFNFPIVLKYCKSTDLDVLKRFDREVRNITCFNGNTKVIQIHDYNVNYQPPYFVMQYFPEKDLSTLCPVLATDNMLQEKVFNAMIDCVNELHGKSLQHRDIKPHNFLRCGDHIIISDLGLAKEVGAGTTFTQNNEAWGTESYLPPEFRNGGFRASEPTSDIFMLGKSFYYLLTQRDPVYLSTTNIHQAIYHVIDKCCKLEKSRRYQNLAELKQGLTLAYDIILNRSGGSAIAHQNLTKILDRLASSNQYDPQELEDFVNQLHSLPSDEQNQIITDLPPQFYHALALISSSHVIEMFLDCYEQFVGPAVIMWSYAEIVATNMSLLFNHTQVPENKARSLEIAINGAISANRFAAMNTCRSMIMNVSDDQLGLLVATIIGANRGTFIAKIEPSECKNDLIKKAIREMNEIG